MERYTNLILKNGFLNNSWEVEIWKYGQKFIASAGVGIYQIHGAPQAAEEDKIIMRMIQKDADNKVILVHRPDEIEKRYPEFKDLSKFSSCIVFLGGKHINDKFYSGFANRLVIPHGFFDVREVLQKDPIIIGSYTTWGEMRSVEIVLRLLKEIFELNNNQFYIIGYLGGRPAGELDIRKLDKLCRDLNVNNLKLTDITEINQLREPTIIVDSSDIEPKDFGFTFNIQMYNFEGGIRTGESSGSLHAGVSVPVILEMNGSEIIEDIRVIKVPYSSLNNIDSVDYVSGAKKIIDSIKDKNYISMLEHNLNQAKKINNTFVAKSYIEIFRQLKFIS